MEWTAYRVAFRLLSPLHIGWRKVGYLQQTRSYVTGRNLWGVLTERLVRDVGGDYASVGQKVDEQLAFSYFYVSTAPREVSLWPWDNEEEFSWTFLGSYASTALSSKTAEEGSLHEIEYLAPYTRLCEPVYLIGYVFEREDCRLKWRDVLERLSIGAERGYGWGRVSMAGPPETVEGSEIFGYKWESANRPLIVVPDKGILMAHTRWVNVECAGLIEPLVGRITETTTGRFGANLSTPEICWVPGSQTLGVKEFLLIEKGLWQCKSLT